MEETNTVINTKKNKKIKFKTGVLLVNLGTPDNCDTKALRKYLNEFLSDPKVIDIHPFLRFLLLQLVILPGRSKKIAEAYKSIWMDGGSPLLVYGKKVKEALQKELGETHIVELGMRYGSPSIKKALETFKDPEFDSIILIPLFPQYAGATSGSIFEKLTEIIKEWNFIPSIKFISYFYDNDYFTGAFAETGKKHLENEKYDHIIFSFHSLPVSQIKKADIKNYCKLNDTCCSSVTEKNQYCYRAQCYKTARDIAGKLGLKKEEYSICFQSRLGKADWVSPYTDELLAELAAKGLKKILAFSPAFVADCLETTFEIGLEYKKMFIEKGGTQLDLVESLNDNPKWIEALKDIVLKA